MQQNKNNKTIKEIIESKFHSLSKKQQRVADFVLNSPAFVGTHSAADVGIKAGASETTVIRFCYAIGLSGYAELQREMTLFVFNESRGSTLSHYFSSKEDIFHDRKLIEKAMGRDAVRINRIMEQINSGLFHEVTEALHKAEHVYIIGAGASKFAADWLHFTMNILRPNVSLIQTETTEFIRTLQKIDEQSLVIVISLHRYMREPVQIAESLHKRGLPVIAITDSTLSPVYQYCKHAFVLEQTEKSTIDLMPALISLLNALVTGMMGVDPSYYNEQRVNYDDFSYQFIADKWS